MKWKTANSPEDWAEAMSQLAEANGCGYVEECLALKALREENARLQAVVQAVRKLNELLNTWPNTTAYSLKYLPAACELNEALARLKEAKE